MSDVASVIARPHTGTGFMRWPLMVLGLIGLGTFGLLTLYAAGHVYMSFDVSVERWIQGLSWGGLVTDVIARLALGIGWTALVLSTRPLSNPALARSR
ncbi:MAG TPA: hypothetical protein VMW11_11210 [Candidatus Dormibacteraeota bacterium]|nr:hypothetical protein [Candidatus Dormibacteraeota bacterium]